MPNVVVWHFSDVTEIAIERRLSGQKQTLERPTFHNIRSSSEASRRYWPRSKTGRSPSEEKVRQPPSKEPTRIYEQNDLLKRINLICPVQSHLQKFSASPLTQIKSISLAVPPHLRGVSRSSRTRGWMRWTRQRRVRNVIAGRDEPRER